MHLKMPKYAPETSKYALKTKLFLRIKQKTCSKYPKNLNEGKN